jgi:hypothetical protein
MMLSVEKILSSLDNNTLPVDASSLQSRALQPGFV